MKYKALIYNSDHDFTFEEREMPECGDNDIIVKNLVASICGSDTDTWLNGGALHLIPSGEEFGHEVVSQVVKAGKNVKDLQVGDRIAPYPVLFTPNIMKSGWLGAFSEYIYGTNAVVGQTLFKLDDSLSNEEAALIEPMSVSVNAADCADVKEDSVIIILGGGIIGFGVAARFVQKGIPKKNIIFVERAVLRIQMLREQGFPVVDTKEENWQQTLFEYTGTTYGLKGIVSNADYIYDTAGSINPNSTAPTLLEQAFAWCKYGCKIMEVGVHRRKVNVPIEDMVFCCWSLMSVGSGGLPAFANAIEMLKAKPVDFKAVVTHTFPFEQAVEAVKCSCNADECFKVEIDFTK